MRACVFLRVAGARAIRVRAHAVRVRACVRITRAKPSLVCVVLCVPCRRLDGQTLVEIGTGYGTAPPPTSARLPPGTVTPPLRNAGTGALALALASASNRVLSIDKSCSVQRAGAPIKQELEPDTAVRPRDTMSAV